MYNLTRYHIEDKVIVSRVKYDDPYLEGIITGKAPKMMRLSFGANHYFGSAQERWLSAEEWYVVARIKS